MLLQYNQSPDAKAVVIYHANCMDGFAAAWAFKRLAEWRYGGGVEYISANYGDSLNIPNNKKTDLFIVDFSFPRSILAMAAAYANTVTVLDHHKTAAEGLQNWINCPSNMAIYFDMNRSGAGITWDFCKDWNHLYNNAPIDFGNTRSGLVSYVEDRDLWRFKLPDSREVNAYIALADHTFDAYDELYVEITNNYDKVVEIGDALERKHFKIATQIAEHARDFVEPFAPTAKPCVVNCPPQFASDVGNILAQKYDFVDCWWQDKKFVIHHSLRSADKVDVSAIAKYYGGGGHKNAAGYKDEDERI